MRMSVCRRSPSVGSTNCRTAAKPAFWNARIDARFSVSGSAMQAGVGGIREDDVVDELSQHVGAESASGEPLVRDEQIHSGDVLLHLDQVAVLRVVAGPIGLDKTGGSPSKTIR